MGTVATEYAFYSPYGRVVVMPQLRGRVLRYRKNGSLDLRFKVNREYVSELSIAASDAYLRGD